MSVTNNSAPSYTHTGPEDTTDAGGGGAEAFVLTLVAAGAIYCGGGFAMGYARGKPGQHPHTHLWRDGLARVGAVVRGSGSEGGATARAVPKSGLDDAEKGRGKRPSDAHSHVSSSSRKSSKGKKDKSEKSDKKSKSKSKSKSKDMKEPLAPLAAPAPAPAREWQPTRSQPHLAVGARETGVKVEM